MSMVTATVPLNDSDELGLFNLFIGILLEHRDRERAVPEAADLPSSVAVEAVTTATAPPVLVATSLGQEMLHATVPTEAEFFKAARAYAVKHGAPALTVLLGGYGAKRVTEIAETDREAAMRLMAA